ncbi:MAG: hypothetical protein QOD99_938 [Chthoniobacter sp.]|jgi:uncharacterized protein (TIGR03663 family)|nr:hypothetical protein [Chthoniobacter sp.]
MSIPKSRWNGAWIILLAAVLRLVLLGMKPPHFDEGVNGWFVDQITKTGRFHYDPTNYHGPLHFYLLFLFQTLLGRSIWVLRLPAVLASIGTVWLVLKFDRFLGSRVSKVAALALALSPGAVFYGRYAIHESELVLFLVLTLFGMIGLWREGTVKYLWALTLGLTGMVLTKETYIIHLGCFILAAGCLWLLEKVSPSAEAAPAARQSWRRRDLLLCVVAGIGLIVFFYSGTFLDFKSLHGLYQCYAAWFQTGKEGHGHEKPFYYWFHPLMLRYEWTALAGIITAGYLLLPRQDRLMRYVAIYGCGAIAGYSIVHYKTPWCIISLLWPFSLLFGYGIVQLSGKYPRTATSFLLSLLAVSGGWTIWLNFLHCVDEGEPYVYVQTLNDVYKLVTPLEEIARQNPANRHVTGHVMVSSYHPLPWMLGDFTGIGYYDQERTPDDLDGDFLLVEPDRVDDVEKALQKDYFTTPLQIRGSQDVSKLYLSVEKFRSVFPGRTPEFVPDHSTGEPEGE